MPASSTFPRHTHSVTVKTEEGIAMLVKVMFGGGGAAIPVVGVGLGIAVIFVWIDRAGFTSATNSLGSLGELVLETPEIDLGEVDQETQQAFASLHGKVVHFIIQPQTFIRSGGIARITMAVPMQEGQAATKTLEIAASDCTGIAFVANALDFSCEMVQQARVAYNDGEQVIPDDVLASLVDGAAGQEQDA